MPLKIYKRGATWHFRGTVAGRRLRGSTGTADKTIAQRVAAETEQRQWKGHLDGPGAVLTFAQAAMLYRAAGKSTRFLERVEDHWKDALVKDITPGVIAQAAIQMYPKAGPATRNRQAIAVTQAVINHASKMELCSFIRVERFKAATKVRKPVTLGWVQKFAAHALPHQAALAWFMFQTGARVSEALRVTWDDVDLQKRTVLLGQRKTKSERLAHLPPETFTAIANMPRDRKRVFLYVTRMGAYKAWTTACKRAGIERLPYHSCRHGFATGLLQAGYDVVTVAKAGGWKNARQVLETYGHANDDPTITDALSGTNLTHAKTRRAKPTRKIGGAA